MLRISYGYKANFDISDPFIKLAEMFCDVLSKSCALGKWLVDSLPSCTCSNSRLSQSLCTFYSVKNAPEFLPGTKFKSKAREMSKDIDEFCEKPFRFVKNSLVVRIFHDYTLRLCSCHVGTWNCYRLFHLRVASGQYRYWWRYNEGCIINPVRRRCRHSEFRASRHE